MTENNEDSKSSLLKKAPWAIIGAIIIGMLGSGLWDLLAKPGLTYLGRFFLNLITLGSKTIQDSAYAMAGLDPTPISSLLIITIIPFFILNFFLNDFLDLFVGPILDKKFDKRFEKEKEIILDESVDNCKKTEILSKYKKTAKQLKSIKMGTLLLIFLAAYLSSQIINQSVVIWRVFNANVRIISPNINEETRLSLLSEFSNIKSKSDYLKLEKKLVTISSKSNIALRDEKLW